VTATPAVLHLGRAAPAGAAVGWVSGGQRHVEYGGLTAPAGQPIAPETVFDLASVTKVVATTCALARLAGLGQISLTDPADRYLGWAALAPGVTLSTLAYHRAGLWEWQPLYLAGPAPTTTLAALPARYPAQSGRHYSDLSFMALGLVIELVMGCRLDQAVAELVFDPLGLTSLGFAPLFGPTASSSWGDAIERQMVATGQPYPVLFHDPGFAWRDGEINGQANDGNAWHSFGGVAGHAGVFGALGDLLTLLESLAVDEDFWAPPVSATIFADGPDAGQAFGWRSGSIELGGHPARCLWHPGFTGCGVGFVPGRGIGVAMLTNRLLAPAPVDTAELWAASLVEVESALR